MFHVKHPAAARGPGSCRRAVPSGPASSGTQCRPGGVRDDRPSWTRAGACSALGTSELLGREAAIWRVEAGWGAALGFAEAAQHDAYQPVSAGLLACPASSLANDSGHLMLCDNTQWPCSLINPARRTGLRTRTCTTRRAPNAQTERLPSVATACLPGGAGAGRCAGRGRPGGEDPATRGSGPGYGV